MWKSDYQLWLKYRSEMLDRKLTQEEYREIRACDFAMHLLIPSNALLEMCGGYENLYTVFCNPTRIKELATIFVVPEEVMHCKIEYLLLENKKQKKKQKWIGKISKRKDNIIFIK